MVKRWQIGVFIAAAVVLGWSVRATFFPGPRTAGSLRMVDVETGEIFKLKVGRGGAMIPGVNPRTERVTLLPVARDDEGRWRVARRYLAALSNIAAEPAAIDVETGLVTAGR
jgi:hypothetical protein